MLGLVPGIPLRKAKPCHLYRHGRDKPSQDEEKLKLDPGLFARPDTLRDPLLHPPRDAGAVMPEIHEVGAFAGQCVVDAVIDEIAARVNLGRVIDIPSGIGFCLYITRACLDGVG